MDVNDTIDYALQIDDHKVGWLTLESVSQDDAVRIPVRDRILEQFAREYPGRDVRLVKVETRHTVLAVLESEPANAVLAKRRIGDAADA